MTFNAVLGRDPFTFFTGTATNSNLVQPRSVMLGGMIYPIDLRNYRHSSQETLREGAVTQAETSDALFNANGAWSRYRYTWHYGAGQRIADFGNQASEFRFNSSIGIDPWTQDQLSLLKDTVVAKALTTAGNQMCYSNGRLYLSDGTDLYYTTDLSSWIVATAPGGNILSMTTDGVDLYVATTTVMRKYANSAPSTPVSFSTPVTGNCTLVSFVANRLLLAKDNVLYEVAAAGSLTTIKTHYQSSFFWTTVFAVGSRIYIGGYAGTRSELYTVTTDTTGSLVQSVEAAPLPTGELLRNGYAYAGTVLLCTSGGVRLAQVGGDGTLTYGPLLAAFGDVSCATFSGRFAWVGWTNHPSGGRGTARLALDTNVDLLQPAYASDIYETITVSGSVTNLVRFLNKTCFIVDGVGLYTEASTYVAEGTIDSGDMFFGTVENKALTAMSVVFDPLASGESVVASVYNDRATFIGSGLQSELSADHVEVTLDGQQVRHCMVTLALRSTGATSPTVFYWRLRAYPVPPAVLQWIVPLIIHSRVVVNGGMGQELTMDPMTEAARIRQWFETREQITYQEGSNAYRVRVDAFELQPSEWTDDGGFFQHTMVVRLVSA